MEAHSRPAWYLWSNFKLNSNRTPCAWWPAGLEGGWRCARTQAHAFWILAHRPAWKIQGLPQACCQQLKVNACISRQLLCRECFHHEVLSVFNMPAASCHTCGWDSRWQLFTGSACVCHNDRASCCKHNVALDRIQCARFWIYETRTNGIDV